MTWFKVDDKFHSHAKVARLGDDTDALALWVVAGSWSADQLSDGWVPAFVARRLDPDYTRRAAALVRVGLWEEADRDGEKGWLFHGWNEEGRQPTAEQVQQERALKTARQQRWREKHRASNGRFDVDGDVDASTDASRDGDVDTARVDTAPTRPDPTTKDSLRSSLDPPASSLRSDAPPTEGGQADGRAKVEPKAKRGTRIPENFALTADMRAWGRTNAPNVDGERETVKFINHFQSVPGQRGVKLDWERTWQNWILKAAEQGSSPVAGSPAAVAQTPKPTWCGQCNERTRMLDDSDQPERCPRCHPSTRKADDR